MSRSEVGGPQGARLHVGTSGWSYEHWRGAFYPEGLRPADRLAYYATRFGTVEIDGTFYRLPSAETIARWRDAVPDDFLFAVKGSRSITHYRRLAGAREQVATFLDRMGELGPKLAVVLWQLPPTLARDDGLLEAFLDAMPQTGLRHAVEFRHESWLDARVFEALRERGTAMVNASGDALREDLTPTTGFVYARFHGTSRYHGAYERPALEPWASFLEQRLAESCEVFAYFNNDFEAHAPADAARLVDMLGERGAPTEPTAPPAAQPGP